jgi:transcriptional regulator with XRE-family HTH domain
LLKELFRSKGIKQKWLAEKLGVSEVTVSNWVKQKTTPNETHLKKLAELLVVPIDQLKMFYGKY